MCGLKVSKPPFVDTKRRKHFYRLVEGARLMLVAFKGLRDVRVMRKATADTLEVAGKQNFDSVQRPLR